MSRFIFFLAPLLLFTSCSVKKSIGMGGKLQAVSNDAMAQHSHFTPISNKVNTLMTHVKSSHNPSRIIARYFSKKQPVVPPESHFASTLQGQTKGDGNNPLKGKSKRKNSTDPDPRATEKLGIVGFAAGVIGVVGLFAINFLPIIFVAAVIALLGGLVGLMRDKEKYKRQGFAKASLVLGLITLIGLAIML
jgi:hypothetical protein